MISYEISELEEARAHTEARTRQAKGLGHKVIAISASVDSSLHLAELAEEETFQFTNGNSLKKI